MPRFDLQMSAVAQTATAIVKAGELARSSSDLAVRREWGITRLEALYELAFLRIFASWENCLEAIFYRSLCGFASTAGQETLVTGPHFRSLNAAEAAVLRPGNTYTLWHNPNKVIQRCQQFIMYGTGYPSCQQRTLASNLARLEFFSFTRHRIVHDQANAKNKFDTATTNLAGRTYPASRPGKFLRDWDRTGATPRRWLDTLTAELTGLTGQMV